MVDLPTFFVVGKQNSCTNLIDKGISKTYVPPNTPCQKPIKRGKGFNGRFE
jgi:hypothetical protein